MFRNEETEMGWHLFGRGVTPGISIGLLVVKPWLGAQNSAKVSQAGKLMPLSKFHTSVAIGHSRV
jgi:hypothetical protein